MGPEGSKGGGLGGGGAFVSRGTTAALAFTKKYSSPTVCGHATQTRLATSVCQPRHDQMEQGPTEPRIGRSMFLLSSGGAGGGYY